MIYTVYVLYSPKHQKIYIGYSSNLIERFKSHNHLSKKGYTKNFRPWMVAHAEWFNTKDEALKREKKLKSGFGRNLIHNQLIPKFKLLMEGAHQP